MVGPSAAGGVWGGPCMAGGREQARPSDSHVPSRTPEPSILQGQSMVGHGPETPLSLMEEQVRPVRARGSPWGRGAMLSLSPQKMRRVGGFKHLPVSLCGQWAHDCLCLSVCLCLPVCLSQSLSVLVSLSLSLPQPSRHPPPLCHSVSVCLSVCPCVSDSVCPCVSVSLSVPVSLSLSVSVSVCLSVCLPLSPLSVPPPPGLPG